MWTYYDDAEGQRLLSDHKSSPCTLCIGELKTGWESMAFKKLLTPRPVIEAKKSEPSCYVKDASIIYANWRKRFCSRDVMRSVIKRLLLIGDETTDDSDDDEEDGCCDM